ncbi:hypothetical protein [Halobaculum lipolyticum]|uniref:Uncharacterized protein n=1 Tax=Halobaculum lipolyticum TaxID=3032001 RepID=A0ABD5W931_9EURY|nr:hypothetical protein [Halobaculum sp. DT31]
MDYYPNADEPLPEGWQSGERTDERVEYARPCDEPATGELLLRAVRTCTGPFAGAAGPLWDLQVETRSRDVRSAYSFGNAGCRSDARRKLVRAMETVESVACRPSERPITAATVRDELAATERSRPLE